MAKKKVNRIASIRHRFPTIEFTMTLFFLFVLILSITQYVKGSQEHLVFVPITLLLFVGLYFVTNWRNKTIIIEPDSITIKTPLKLKSMTFHKSQLRGFELTEILSGYGLIKNIRVVTTEEKKIEFFRDVYTETDYQRLIDSLKKSNLNYLGTSLLKSKNKRLYASIGKWALVVAMILFGLLQVVKLFK
jgi:hypothetical protein